MTERVKRVCPECGQEKEMFASDRWCGDCAWRRYQEGLEQEAKATAEKIRAGEYAVADYLSMYFIFCPHCGHFTDVDSDEMEPMHHEGDYEQECPECQKKFVLHTRSCGYYFETEKEG